jgi:hypothetical protein
MKICALAIALMLSVYAQAGNRWSNEACEDIRDSLQEIDQVVSAKSDELPLFALFLVNHFCPKWTENKSGLKTCRDGIKAEYHSDCELTSDK